ncbi:DNRLRE domain-containing protein [Clostridium beijerinckii]|uniref:DNRLRE domain-containing protein n=1 Tax=Clostridium beijerinckii TaxID=1520 RepID=A0AAW3W8W9_CLOBE|nr:DNRLRE domain-containing protein [Clostridium beijerinckii]MBC2457656.1 DNRLRE domain-containing protein [Clostridium beijerinckii]MBC2474929.1 DNRLRE domain-containing protein [Clostridium beijerinckii]MDG5854746.1 DNRLRE domain-containing protein [Clostridium beijerinckii]NOV60169.1 putative nucleic acid-binding Zn-ribbon protein [Clostridium beijerinckii]NOV71054.1 putative nucleic acid-binding Zn-ribbon protein [Clostridium beijerinckii]
MENSIKAICNTSTYLDKYHSNTNFSSNDSLLVGSINNRSLGNNRYISLLNFQLSELHPNSVKKAYLYLFIQDIKPDYKNSFSFGILGNYSNIDIAAIDWSSLPKKDYTKLLNHIVHGYNIGHYLKINVTSLIRSLATHNESYNIFLLPQNQDSNSIIKLSSFESKYPPYLDIITYNTDSTNNIDLSEELNIETYIEEPVEENTYDDEETETNNSEDISASKESSNVERDSVKDQEDVTLINHLLNKVMEILVNQDLKLNSLNSYSESLGQEINILSNKVADIGDKISSLDEDSTNLKQNDIETLNINMSSLNNQLLELKALLPNLSVNIENLKETINEFTKTGKPDFSNLNSISSQLLEVSSNFNSLTKLICSIKAEPVN